MLNDIKNWAIEKGDHAKDAAIGVANEVQTKDVMDWSGTVWVIIAVGVVIGIGTLISASIKR